MPVGIQLTQRQQGILRRLVEEFVASGQPVGSKTLVERGNLTAGPSTVRAELAELESLGLLTHPHTSAGRVPTERGYRCYADELLRRNESKASEFALDVHIEVLLLQADLVMVVVITSAGGVTKRTFHFEAAVDPGLAQWANEYLNET